MPRPDMMRDATRLALAALLAGVMPLGAAAQIFAGTQPTMAVAMPQAPDDPAAQAPQPPASVRRFLPSTYDGLRLVGERGDLRWPVYLTAAQAGESLRFRIGYSSTVSVLPESSRLAVRVNDQEIGADAIDAPRGTRVIEYAIPSGTLHEGYNAISVSVQQRHRVDCSVAATYELWTKIDPTETGLVLPAAASSITRIADLAALLPMPDGSLPIHVLLAGKTNPANLQRLMKAVQSVAIAGRFVQPVVDFGGGSPDVYGLDVAVGTRAVLLHMPQVATAIGAQGPLARILPAAASARPILVVTGSTDAEVDQALASLASVGSLEGSPAGLAAAENYPAFKTEGGEPLSLRTLGIHGEEFSGRFFRKSFNLMLPADFMASDYGRGTFDLAGGYAAGLAHGAQVRVDVNGKSSGIIKLPYAGGDVFRHNQLFVPLSLMRPGLNRFDVFAETPRPEDATCEASTDKRFLFLDSSTLVLPTLARVGRLPDLAETTSGGLPFAQGRARLVVPKPDRQTMGAALSIVARAGVAAGKVIPFAFSTRMPQDDDSATLVVSPARALDPALMSAIGLDPAEVERAWRGIAETRDAARSSKVQGRWWMTDLNGPPACRVPSPATSVPVASAPAQKPAASTPIAAAAMIPRKGDSDDLLESWSDAGRHKVTWPQAVKDAFAKTGAWIETLPNLIKLPAAGPAYSNGIGSNASLILAQGIGSRSHDGTVTIVTAPDPAVLHASVACLFDPQVWARIHGRLATLDASTGAVTATDATSFRYVAGARSSLANSRLVLAGWFSLNPIAFVALSMLLALCLSGTTLWFVRGIGRRSE